MKEEKYSEDRQHVSVGCFLALGMFSLMIACVFGPLVASYIEYQLFDSDYVYEAFQAVGLADPLGQIYDLIPDAVYDLLE